MRWRVGVVVLLALAGCTPSAFLFSVNLIADEQLKQNRADDAAAVASARAGDCAPARALAARRKEIARAKLQRAYYLRPELMPCIQQE